MSTAILLSSSITLGGEAQKTDSREVAFLDLLHLLHLIARPQLARLGQVVGLLADPAAPTPRPGLSRSLKAVGDDGRLLLEGAADPSAGPGQPP